MENSTVSRCMECTKKHLTMGTINQLYNKCNTCPIGRQEHKSDHDKWNGHVTSTHK